MTAEIFKIGLTWYINYMEGSEVTASEWYSSINCKNPLQKAVARAKHFKCKSIIIYADREA